MYKLIIVDDEMIIRESMRQVIPWEKLGVRCLGTCANGYEAIDKVTEDTPDIIITDVKMPLMSGIELIQKVRKISEGVIFIVLSGYNEFEFAQKAMQEGVKYYLLKPSSEEQIIDVIRKSMNELDKRQSKELRRKEEYLKKIDYMLYEFERISEIAEESRRKKEIIKITEAYYMTDVIVQASIKFALRYINMGVTELAGICIELEDSKIDKKKCMELIDCMTGRISKYKAKNENFVEYILKYIENNLDNEQLTLKYIANECVYMNIDYISRSFIKYTGESFSKYLTKLRIEKAKRLIETNKQIKMIEVAECIGMGNNPRYFSQLFKKCVGCTPKEYQQNV